MLELAKAVGAGLAMLLPLANPLTTMALLLALSKGMTDRERNRQALLASCYVFAIMVVALYAGQAVMGLFGISISGLRVAGGLIVAFIGFRMLFPDDRLERGAEVERQAKDLREYRRRDIAFIPLAMPSTAGPGTIALIISAAAVMKEEAPFSPWVMAVAPVLTFFLVSVILWLCLRGAGTLIRVIGQGGVDACARLMGFLLVCLGVQFVIYGVVAVVEDFPQLA
ncbi:MAG TPA: MarC family NAAT transporter [Lysobacter sp.]